MGKYVYVYYAGAGSDGGSNEEWGKWFGELGDKLVDGGNPFAEGGQAVHQGGVMAYGAGHRTGKRLPTSFH
jgi:hypothetical protein